MLRAKFSELRKYIKIGKERVGGGTGSDERIGYIGGQGNYNLGDDAMFDAIRLLMPQPFHVLSYHHPIREDRLSRIGLGGKRFFSQVILGGGHAD